MSSEIKELAELACNVTGEVLGIDVAQIKGSGCSRPVAEARMVARSVAMWVGGHASRQVGRAFGAPHHSILYARDRVLELMSVDAEFTRAVSAIRHRVQAAWRVLQDTRDQGGAK